MFFWPLRDLVKWTCSHSIWSFQCRNLKDFTNHHCYNRPVSKFCLNNSINLVYNSIHYGVTLVLPNLILYSIRYLKITLRLSLNHIFYGPCILDLCIFLHIPHISGALDSLPLYLPSFRQGCCNSYISMSEKFLLLNLNFYFF